MTVWGIGVKIGVQYLVMRPQIFLIAQRLCETESVSPTQHEGSINFLSLWFPQDGNNMFSRSCGCVMEIT